MKNKKSMSGIVIMLLGIGMMMFAGCDSSVGGDDLSLTYNQKEVTLPDSLTKVGSIYDITSGMLYNGSGTIKFGIHGTMIEAGTVTDGVLTLDLPNIDVLIESGVLGSGGFKEPGYSKYPDFVNISPDERKGFFVGEIQLIDDSDDWVGKLYLESADKGMFSWAEVFFWYYDESVTISGSKTVFDDDLDREVFIHVNVHGQKGWNSILDSVGSVGISDLKWLIDIK